MKPRCKISLRTALRVGGSLCGALVLASAIGQEAVTARSTAPVDLTGQWVSVVTEDWAWRMHTPPKGDYASLPLNTQGRRVADTWTEDQHGSCLAFGAAALLRNPTRVRISWEDEQTLKLETDHGMQTRLLRFDSRAPTRGAATLQGDSVAAWQIASAVTGSGATAGILTSNLESPRWASLKVVTTNLSPAWLRPNGVPYSGQAVLIEYFDRFSDGQDEWFTVTTRVEDPTYLTEPLLISSNFKRETNLSGWRPTRCRE